MSYGPSRSRLLLTELICNLAIFALCAVVCACLLLQSWSISRESSELTQAVTLAQTAAEVWRADGTQPADLSDSQSGLSVVCSAEGRALTVEVYADDGQRLVYRLEGVRSFG